MKTISLQVISIICLFALLTNCKSQDDTSPIEEINEWVQRSSLPTDELRLDANIITYNNRAFLLPGKGGSRFSTRPGILEYAEGNWTRVATYDGFATAGRSEAIRNNDEIYLLGGVNGSNAPTDEVRSYSISDNTFREETRFSSTFTATYTESKAYFGDENSFTSFDFSTNAVETLPVIPSNESISAARLTTENNIIFAFFSLLESNNFFAFDTNSNEWSQLPDFPGESRTGALIVSTDSDIYVGLGSNPTPLLDIWRFNIETNEWLMFTEYPGTHFRAGFAFELNGRLFFGGGFTGAGPISPESLNEEVYSIRVR